MTTLTSRADVATDAPARYAKQLVSHLGRKVAIIDNGDGSRTSQIGDARASIADGEDLLTLGAEAPDEAALTQVEHALGSHLDERFGHRDHLVVTWHR